MPGSGTWRWSRRASGTVATEEQPRVGPRQDLDMSCQTEEGEEPIDGTVGASRQREGEQMMRMGVRTARTVIGAVLLAAVGVGLPASAAYADKPTRTVIQPENFVIPAGEGCSFPVGEEIDDLARVRLTEFSDGRVVLQGRAHPTLTNLHTGKSLVHHTVGNITDYPSEAGETTMTVNGQLFMGFWPGDQGPFGLVEYPGALYSVNGHVRATYDSSTLIYTSFELAGTATDLCAALASE